MRIDGKPYRTIWLNEDGWSVEIINQTRLPHRFETITLRNSRRCGPCHQIHAGARRTADRGDRRLRHCGDAGGPSDIGRACAR